jgi:hypothetical protein
MNKADTQIITELKAKLQYHHICIDELNERMNIVMNRIVKNNKIKAVNKLTSEQITGLEGEVW